jgi:hypothetical protein
MAAKSYWGSVYVGDARSQEAVKSWFGAMVAGMTVSKAEILCNIETDREKKIRIFATDADNKNYQLVRTLGGRTFSISRKLVAPPVTRHDLCAPTSGGASR